MTIQQDRQKHSIRHQHRRKIEPEGENRPRYLAKSIDNPKQPQPAALNYPFDFAFFAHEAPGRCPLMQVPEILTAPRSPVAKLMMQLCVAGLAEGHQIVIPMRPAL